MNWFNKMKDSQKHYAKWKKNAKQIYGQEISD